jgi:HSP20 family protein
MALVRWKDRRDLAPWSAFRDLEDEVSRIFGSWTRDLDRPTGTWAPAVDVKETDESYTIEADLPGVNKDDIELTVLDNALTIKGERKSEEETKEKGYRRVERRYGNFQRSFHVPGGFDAGKVSANFDKGVLRVTLPKREESKPKQIEVKVN